MKPKSPSRPALRDSNVDRALEAPKRKRLREGAAPVIFGGVDDKRSEMLAAAADYYLQRLASKKPHLDPGFAPMERLVQRDPTIERDPVTNFSAEAVRLGVPLDPTKDPEQAKEIIRRVAEDALDLFGSTEAAVAYLSSKDIDGFGHTGLNLVAERGLSAVLMKLDELRFGFAG